MKIAAFAVLMLVLSACAPGVYVLEWNTPVRSSGFNERVVERVIEVEVEVPVNVPRPKPEPPVVIPREPVPLPPVTPVEPPACDVKSMPAKSPWLEKIKCPGEPARLVPRP